MNMIAGGQNDEPLFNQFYQYLGINEGFGSNYASMIRNKSQVDKKGRKKRSLKDNSMCFQVVGRENTMCSVHDRMKLIIDNKYNPNFSLIERKVTGFKIEKPTLKDSFKYLDKERTINPCAKLYKAYNLNNTLIQPKQSLVSIIPPYSEAQTLPQLQKIESAEQSTILNGNQQQTSIISQKHPMAKADYTRNDQSIIQQHKSFLENSLLFETSDLSHQSSFTLKNKLVPIDKLKGREPDFLINKEGPNENRFLNINKSPSILSTNPKAGSPDIGKITGRRGQPIDQYRSNVYYNPNMDAVKPNYSKVVPNFNRFTTRKDIVQKSYNTGVIDNSKVIQGIDFISLRTESQHSFDKQLPRDYKYLSTAGQTDYSENFEIPRLEKVEFSEFLPNSIKKKGNGSKNHLIHSYDYRQIKSVGPLSKNKNYDEIDFDELYNNSIQK